MPFKLLKLAVFSILALLISARSWAVAPTPEPPTVAASGYILMDYDSGRVLAEANSNERLEPASLTKIMTAYVVFKELKEGNINLNEEVLISEHAWQTEGSSMFIEVNKRVTVEDLIKGMIIQSGNDACIALAEHIAGSEEVFAQLMNTNAKRLGMLDSHFVNSTGLPNDDHYTTAADIAKISMATIRDFPEYYAWYKEKEFLFNNIKQHNRNKLLWRDASVDGIKTGHTKSAGFCLAASAVRDGMRLVSVVLGTSSEEARAKATQALFNYGFRFFETHQLYAAGEAVSIPRLWKGEKELLPVGLEKALSVTVPRNQFKNLNARMEIDPQIMAPVQRGDVVGHVIVTLEDVELTQVPLIALESINEGGIWEQTKDTVLLWLE